MKQRFVQLWAGDGSHKDYMGEPAQLPAAFLIDKTGKVVERHMGRMAPAA